jgi:hypothetical protein
MVTPANLAIKRHRSVIAAPSIRCHVFANADSGVSVDDRAFCPFDELRMISTGKSAIVR